MSGPRRLTPSGPFGVALFELLRDRRHPDGAAWSTTDLGRAVGVSANQVRQWITGKATPRGTLLFALADLFGVDAAELSRGVVIRRGEAVGPRSPARTGEEVPPDADVLRRAMVAACEEIDALGAELAAVRTELAALRGYLRGVLERPGEAALTEVAAIEDAHLRAARRLHLAAEVARAPAPGRVEAGG